MATTAPAPARTAHAAAGRAAAPASRRRRAVSYPSWMLWPAFAALLVFFLVPTLLNFVYAFTDWSAFKQGFGFVGTQNFQRLFADGSLLSSLRVTLVWALLVALLQNGFGFVLALLLEGDTRVNRGARIVFFLPVLLSPLAVGYVFQALLRPDGALNGVLGALTGTDVSIAWLGSTTWTIVVVSVVQAYAFLAIAWLWRIEPPLWGYLAVLPALFLSGLMLGALGMLLSSLVRQLENFAGVMNFLIFPMFFASSALYPLWRVRESSPLLYRICELNPFTYAVELIRFALYLRVEPTALAVVVGCTILFMIGAVLAYDPARGFLARQHDAGGHP